MLKKRGSHESSKWQHSFPICLILQDHLQVRSLKRGAIFFGKTGQVDVAIWSELCGDLSRNVAIWRILKNPHVSHFKIKSTIHDFQNLRKLESRIPRKKHCHLDMHFLIPTLKILKPKFRGKDIAICNF